MKLKLAERGRLLALAEEAERLADEEGAKVAAIEAQLEQKLGEVAATQQALAEVGVRAVVLVPPFFFVLLYFAACVWALLVWLKLVMFLGCSRGDTLVSLMCAGRKIISSLCWRWDAEVEQSLLCRHAVSRLQTLQGSSELFFSGL